MLFGGPGQVNRRCGDARHVGVSASREFLHQHKLTVQIALSQQGVETVLETGITLGLDELREWARARLAPYKIPKDLACVARLPRNAMGKVIKPEVAAFFAPPVPPERPAS